MTNHHKTHKWMNIQSKYIKKNTKTDYKIICGITDFSIKDISSELNLRHSKMNKMAEILSTFEPHDTDIIVFIDPDAFPITEDWYGIICKKLEKYPFLAISREENIEPLLNDKFKPYPHPCFCATTYGFWKKNNLSWALDPNRGASCAGVLLGESFKNNNIEWYKMLRTNCCDLHPLMFGIYDNMIFHNGSGNRPAYDSIDIWVRKELSDKYGVSVDLHYPGLIEFNNSLSDLVFDFMQKDDDFIKYYFMGV